MFRTALLVLFIAAILVPIEAAPAKEICSSWENMVEPDMRIAEEDFNQAAAQDALMLLQRLATENDARYEWHEPLNALKIVEGWLARKRALTAISIASPGADTDQIPEVREFCQFWVESGFYYD